MGRDPVSKGKMLFRSIQCLKMVYLGCNGPLKILSNIVVSFSKKLIKKENFKNLFSKECFKVRDSLMLIIWCEW